MPRPSVLAPPSPDVVSPGPNPATLWSARAIGIAAAGAVLLPAVFAAPGGERGAAVLALCAAVAWWLLVVAVIRSDVTSYTIPDEASAAIAALGLAAAAADGWFAGGGEAAAARGAAAAGIGVGAFAVFWVTGFAFKRWGRDALGFGDVKLAGASAIWLAPFDAAIALELAALGAIAALLLARPRGAGVVDTAVPFGAFLAPAAWMVHLLAPTLHGLWDVVP